MKLVRAIMEVDHTVRPIPSILFSGASRPHRAATIQPRLQSFATRPHFRHVSLHVVQLDQGPIY